MTTGGSTERHWLRQRVENLITLGGLLVSVATVTGLAGSLGWAFDLSSHFRVQYLACLVIAAVGLALLRRRRTAAVLACFGLVNLGLIVPLYLRPAPRAGAAAPVRLLLANVHTSNTEHGRVRELIRAVEPDVVVLLEVDRTWMEAMEPLRDLLPHVIARPRSDNFGIAVLTRDPPARSRLVDTGCPGLPSVVAELGAGDGAFTLIATHPFPPKWGAGTRRRDDQLREVADLVGATTTPAVVLGDLNATPWSSAFRRLLRATDLRHASRGHGVQATWPTGLLPLRIPIDHCLCGPEFEVLQSFVGPAIGSDHFPIVVELRLIKSE